NRAILKKNPDSETYRSLIVSLERNKQYDEAAEVMKELFEKHPDEKSAELLDALSQIYLRGGRYDASLEGAREALKLDANDPGAMQLIGLALTRLGKYDEAVAHFKKVLEQFANIEGIVKMAHAALSNTYVEMGDLDKGEAELEILYRADPDD